MLERLRASRHLQVFVGPTPPRMLHSKGLGRAAPRDHAGRVARSARHTLAAHAVALIERAQKFEKQILHRRLAEMCTQARRLHALGL